MAEEVDDDGLQGIRNPESMICLDSTLESSGPGNIRNPDSTICLDSTVESSGTEIVEDDSLKGSVCTTVELETTVTSEESFITVDVADCTKENVESSALSDQSTSTSGVEKKETCKSPEKLPIEDMFVLDSTGSDVSKLEETETDTSPKKEKQGIFPANPYGDDTIDLETTGSISSQEPESSIDDTSPKKEKQGIFPANPYGDDTITLDTTGSVSSQEPESSIDERAPAKENRGIYPENRVKEESGIISLDTSGSSCLKEMSSPSVLEIPQQHEKGKSRTSRAPSMKEKIVLDRTGRTYKATEQDDDIICIEGVSIDIEGDAGGGDEDENAYPYPMHEVPRYDTSVAGVLSDVEYSMDTGRKIQAAKPKKTCFNCLGDHNVPECTEPQNARRIAENRKKQMSNRISNVRYHEDCENKYGQHRPGKISENLREALGLRYGELPMHIYRMRVLGYPPGWLKEAEVRQADMKLYDGTGQSVSHPDSEEGEAEPTLVKYNPDKLVSYPGFNVDVPRGYRDEWRDLNFPRMQHMHKKSEFKRFMELNKAGAYKKRKLKDESLRSNGSNSKDASEMDIDNSGLNVSAEIEFNPPLPDEPMAPLPPGEAPASPEEPVDMEDGELVEDDSQSSIGYLEAKRKALLEQLGDPGSTSNESMLEGTPGEKENTNASDNGNDTESSAQPNEDSENSRSSSSIKGETKQKLKHHRSESKGYKLGAAIPASITPFNTLPDAEKWTVDVTDHINFENLPDALGTWDKMKGLVRRVRKRMEVLHADEDDDDEDE